MSRLTVAVALFLSIFLHACAGPMATCANSDNTTKVTGGKECLLIRTFKSDGPLVAPTLVVFLHGDGSAGRPVDYHYAQAAELARSGLRNVVAVGMIRPGYNDSNGNTSTGSNFGRRDNYTPDNVDSVAGAVATLKAFYGARQVMLVGHSGGAAISAVILGRHPRLASAAVLVSCPCTLDAKRWPQSESPHQYIQHLPQNVRVAALVGSDDTVTSPYLSESYVAALKSRGIAADFVLIPGVEHYRALSSPRVIEIAIRLAKSD